MSVVSVKMPDGRTWTPKFVKEINQEKRIGCGRCFKVCGREVLQLAGVSEDGSSFRSRRMLRMTTKNTKKR